MNDQEMPASGLPDNNRLALRRVARAQRKAALATSLEGRPYVSLVTVAFDHDLSPILLLSGLADHTRNLKADGRCALLLDGTEGHANPQTGPRVTLTGVAEPDGSPRRRARFLARHPAAALYAGFADFALWRLRLEKAHFVGGFGRAVWFDAPLVPADLASAMAEAEAGLLAGLESRRGLPWRVTGLDPDGFEVETGERWAFDPPVEGAESAMSAVLAQAGKPLQ